MTTAEIEHYKQLVSESRKSQGLPPKLTDVVVLKRIAGILNTKEAATW